MRERSCRERYSLWEVCLVLFGFGVFIKFYIYKKDEVGVFVELYSVGVREF